MFKNAFFILTIFCAFVLISCVPLSSRAMFTKTGSSSLQPMPSNCDFNVYTVSPNRDYQELGIIEFSGEFLGGESGGPSSVSEVKRKSAEYVCSAGGNGLLLWESSAYGVYKKATVIFVK